MQNYSVKSRSGINSNGSIKINQDCYCAKHLKKKSDISIFCVLDGHGTYGKQASNYAADFITDYFNKDKLNNYKKDHITDCMDKSIYQILIDKNHRYIKQCFIDIESDFSKSKQNDYSYSGTTAVLILIMGNIS